MMFCILHLLVSVNGCRIRAAGLNYRLKERLAVFPEGVVFPPINPPETDDSVRKVSLTASRLGGASRDALAHTAITKSCANERERKDGHKKTAMTNGCGNRF